MRACRRLFPLLLLAAALGASGAEPEERDLALARSIRGVYRTLPEDSPARYAADLIASRFWHSLELGLLEGTIPATARRLEEARARLGKIRDELDRGRRWTARPPRWRIPFLAVPPVIDGKWSEAEWEKALEIDLEYPLDSTQARAVSGRWRVGYDRKNLYISARFPEKIRRTCPVSDAPGAPQPWDGDAAEIFLLSDPRIPCYREIVINGSGCVLSALHTKRRGEIYLNCRREAPERISTAAGSDPQGGWCFEAAVPFAELPGYFRGNPPRSGEELRLALVRTRDGGFFSAFPLLYSGHNLYGYAAAKLE